MDAITFKTEILPCYKPMMVAAVRLMGDVDEASDVVQDVMRRLWEGHASMEVPDNPRAFCIMAVRNQCISRFRELKRQQKIPIDDAPPMPAADASDDAIISAQGLERVQNAISELPEQRRQVLMMSIRGHTNQEIAARFNLTEVNVRQLLSRVRLQMKEILKQNNN